MYNSSIRVTLTSTDNGATLIPVLDSVQPIRVFPGRTALQWTLTTVNNFSADIATFGSSDHTKMGLELVGSLPLGVPVPTVTGSTDTKFSIDFTDSLKGGNDQAVNYCVNFVFGGKDYSPDPVIVVTPEPVGSGSVILELAQA